MTDELYGVYGSSGFGREVMPLVRHSVAGKLVFIDDAASTDSVNGHAVLSYDAFLRYPAASRSVCLAISNREAREKLADRCHSDGIGIHNVFSENSVILDNVDIGVGAIICPFVTLTSNIKIGKFFHANIYSYVAHDCIIGNYVTFAPGVKCNGNVVIEDGAYVGTGAIIKQGKPDRPLVIGANAVIGMGSVVTKSVPAGQVVIGNPAKPLSKCSLK